MSDYVESPHGVMLAAPSRHLIRQELITYEIKDDAVVKTIVVREFHGNEHDYTDSKITTKLTPSS